MVSNSQLNPYNIITGCRRNLCRKRKAIAGDALFFIGLPVYQTYLYIVGYINMRGFMFSFVHNCIKLNTYFDIIDKQQQ
jgi:hypothetical protein